jgi:hypothetical protein
MTVIGVMITRNGLKRKRRETHEKNPEKSIYTRKELWYTDQNAIIPPTLREGEAE